MTKDEAISATRNGAIAASVSGVLTVAVMAIAISTDSEGGLAFFKNPLNLVGVAPIFICAYGMYMHSRTAAIVIFIYFITAKAVDAVETGQAPGIMAFLFLYLYGKAIQGAFAYHRLEREAAPEYRAMTKKGVVLLGAGVLVVGLEVAFSLFYTFGVIPSTRVLSGDEVPHADIELLRDRDILAAGLFGKSCGLMVTV